jgi:glycosyltransferase involved in cell wall biosynthesis
VNELAFDASLWDEPVTGIGLYTLQLAKALRALGVELELWGARSSGHVRRGGWSRTLWALGPLTQHLRQRRPRLYHGVANFNLPLERVPGVPFVLTVHDVVPVLLPGTVSRAFRWQFRAWLARSVRVADRVICVSETSRRALIEHFDVEPGKLSVVHHGVDHVEAVPEADALSKAWLDALALPEHFILYAGALDARKNVTLVLGALERLKRGGRPATLVLAGQRWYGAGAIEREIARLRDSGLDVRVLGYLQDTVFYALMRRAAVFVFPSRYEGFGLPPLEAMRLGVPTIVSTEGSLPEVCGDGALQVGPDDVVALSEALETLLRHRAERETWAARGLARARQFSWARTAAQTRGQYALAGAL